jgi:IclR family KDG regulon transcriptional repressor
VKKPVEKSRPQAAVTPAKAGVQPARAMDPGFRRGDGRRGAGAPAYHTATLAKGLDVLEALAEIEEIGLSDLARRLDLSAPTLFRILATLVARGYVQKSHATRSYRLTLKTWELGAKAVRRIRLRDVARPAMQALADETQETVHLSVLEGDGIVIVDKIDSPHPVRVNTYVGQRAPAHCSATGKAILAFAPPATVAEITGALARHTAATIVERAAFERELAQVRRAGWAKNREEWRQGVCAAAVPIRGHAAALSVTVPTIRFSNEALRERLLPPLKRAGAAIAAQMDRARG